MVRCPPLGPDGKPLSIVGLDSSIIQNPKVWEASGHVGGFSDPMVDCRETKARYRYDHLRVFRHKLDQRFPIFAFMDGDPAAAQKKVAKVKAASPEDFEEVAFSSLTPEERAR